MITLITISQNPSDSDQLYIEYSPRKSRILAEIQLSLRRILGPLTIITRGEFQGLQNIELK